MRYILVENRGELSMTEVNLKRFKYIEEDYWKQKVRKRWFKDGYSNTKFFHSYVKRSRKKLHILEI